MSQFLAAPALTPLGGTAGPAAPTETEPSPDKALLLQRPQTFPKHIPPSS